MNKMILLTVGKQALTFFKENGASLIVGLVISLLIAGAVLSIRRSRKKGGCGQSCAGCSGCPAGQFFPDQKTDQPINLPIVKQKHFADNVLKNCRSGP